MFERCLPPTWPRPPRPPVPEEEPSSLDEQVDWLTYSHPELYSMIHSGFDLTGAMAVSATWARLGEELGDLGDELAKLLFATAQAWEGESAQLAQESVSALSEWASQTASMANEVSCCVTIQVDNANNARNAMPPPPYPVLQTPTPQPPKPIPAQSTAFSSGDFGTAKPLFTDSMVYTSHERALHQQAARTMERFQESSRDVYATVPQFAPPDLRKMPFGPPPEPPPTPQPPPPPVPQPPLPPGPGRVGGGPGGPGPGGSGGGPAGPGRGTSGPAPLGPGSGTGAAPTEPAANRPAAASARPGAPTAGPTGGGMPMGGAGGQRDEDTERKSKRYVEEDIDVWGANDERVMPPVIGEVNRRA